MSPEELREFLNGTDPLYYFAKCGHREAYPGLLGKFAKWPRAARNTRAPHRTVVFIKRIVEQVLEKNLCSECWETLIDSRIEQGKRRLIEELRKL